MGCTGAVTLTGITYSCTDIPYGGLKRVLLANLADVSPSISVDNATGIVTVDTVTNIIPAGSIVELDFSNKDGFSSWTETKTVDPTGTVKVEENIGIEFPKMTADKRLQLEAMTVPYAKLVSFVEDYSGEYHMVGFEFGMFASEVNGQTGNGRSEKNVYQLKLTGEETHLAYSLDQTAWDAILAGM